MLLCRMDRCVISWHADLLLIPMTGHLSTSSVHCKAEAVITLHCVLATCRSLMLTTLHTLCYTRRCTIRNDAFLEHMGYARPFGASVAILAGYLGVMHVLTYTAMLLLANREAR
jgi:hypothetical protein